MAKPSTESKSEDKDKRVSKEQYYLNIAHEVGKRGTCLRRNFGAVIVKEDQIISTGYSGAPRGTPNCIDVGTCFREELKIPPRTRYELCRGVHAEQNAIIHAPRLDMIGGTLYLAGTDAPTNTVIDAKLCRLCKRMIINAGITNVVIQNADNTVRVVTVQDWIDQYLGEFKKEGGQLIPVMPPDYQS